MLETPHIIVGIAIATRFPNPAVSIPLALASHVILDRIPHWNPHTYTETEKHGKPLRKSLIIAYSDISLAFIIGSTVAFLTLPNIAQATNIMLTCFASVLPDVSKYPFFLFKSARKGLYKRWVDFERSLQVDAEPIPGIINQLIIILTAYLWILA